MHRITPPSSGHVPGQHHWLTAPSLQAIAAGGFLHLGQAGEAVRVIQMLLVARALELVIDGMFGRQTQDAVRQFQRRQGCACDGVVGPETLMQLWQTSPRNRGRPAGRRRTRAPELVARAPRSDAPRPSGTVTAGELQRRAPTTGPADQRLAALQSQAVDFAQAEIGVREQGGNNRGPRVDQYARNAGMPRGGAWCAYFVDFAYSETARANGADFTGRRKLHSYQKNYAWFSYGSYTARDQGRARREGAELRAAHQRQGSTRRYMALEGSPGHRYARNRNLPHEVYQNHQELPIRAGDTALFRRGHVGMVRSYDPSTGRLVTIEGNTGRDGRVRERTYDLSDPAVFAQFDGFGRPALADLTSAE